MVQWGTKILKMPYIDIAATCSTDGKSITVFCVNPLLSDDAPVALKFLDFHPSPQAGVQQISPVSRDVINDEAEPWQGAPQLSNIIIESDNPVRITLPHGSVTVIHVHAR